MPKLIIEGGIKPEGEVVISGSKNASMPIIIASMLLSSDALVTLQNSASTQDICYVLQALREVGFGYNFCYNQGCCIKAIGLVKKEQTNITSSKIAGLIRTSVLFMGPMLARFGHAKLPFPGGCSIGERKIDIHLDALTKLGASILQGEDYAELSAPNGLKGCNFELRFASVGASQNIIMAACLAKGQSIIKNIAGEPEVLSLIEFLNLCGASIEYDAQTKTAIINGTGGSLLNPKGEIIFKIPSDRIEAGTFIILAAVTDGKILLKNIKLHEIESFIPQLQNAGCKIEELHNGILASRAQSGLNSFNLETNIHPAFPTDLQPQLTTLFCLASKPAIVTETIFENRFAHIKELNKIGAKAKVDGKICTINPVKSFCSTSNVELIGHDLRASAAVVMAALARPSGTTTTIASTTQLDRGYELFDAKLNKCGAKIKRQF